MWPCMCAFGHVWNVPVFDMFFSTSKMYLAMLLKTEIDIEQMVKYSPAS